MEFRVLVADLPVFLVLRHIAPSLDFFHAFPNLNDDALLGWVPFNHSYLSSSGGPSHGYDATTGCFDQRLGFRDILLGVTVLVGHIDLRHIVDGRLGLRMEPL